MLTDARSESRLKHRCPQTVQSYGGLMLSVVLGKKRGGATRCSSAPACNSSSLHNKGCMLFLLLAFFCKSENPLCIFLVSKNSTNVGLCKREVAESELLKSEGGGHLKAFGKVQALDSGYKHSWDIALDPKLIRM